MKDQRQGFLIESCDVRGQFISLDSTWQEACARVEYPEAIAQVLGEAFVATGLLSAIMATFIYWLYKSLTMERCVV